MACEHVERFVRWVRDQTADGEVLLIGFNSSCSFKSREYEAPPAQGSSAEVWQGFRERKAAAQKEELDGAGYDIPFILSKALQVGWVGKARMKVTGGTAITNASLFGPRVHFVDLQKVLMEGCRFDPEKPEGFSLNAFLTLYGLAPKDPGGLSMSEMMRVMFCPDYRASIVSSYCWRDVTALIDLANHRSVIGTLMAKCDTFRAPLSMSLFSTQAACLEGQSRRFWGFSVKLFELWRCHSLTSWT
jgi:hypothetical protein